MQIHGLISHTVRQPQETDSLSQCTSREILRHTPILQQLMQLPSAARHEVDVGYLLSGLPSNGRDGTPRDAVGLLRCIAVAVKEEGANVGQALSPFAIEPQHRTITDVIVCLPLAVPLAVLPVTAVDDTADLCAERAAAVGLPTHQLPVIDATLKGHAPVHCNAIRLRSPNNRALCLCLLASAPPVIASGLGGSNFRSQLLPCNVTLGLGLLTAAPPIPAFALSLLAQSLPPVPLGLIMVSLLSDLVNLPLLVLNLRLHHLDSHESDGS
mmetsp:Transcript_18173/g.51718  ORF Transcript_18173/g.51718 Transcript_18173/m.51718 type:complete len:269 (+) Transcript_18173:1915-2721(+)